MEQQLENIWNAFAAKLKQFIVARVHDVTVSEDILQEVFLKVQQRLGQLEDAGKLQGWIYQITRNAIADYFRAQKPTAELAESIPALEETPEGIPAELACAFRGMVDALPEPYREAVVLADLEGLSQKELAERLSISYSGAKSRVQRGREKLKEALLECCRFQFDRRGNIIECEPRNQSCPQCELP